jgi:hypothetical protein
MLHAAWAPLLFWRNPRLLLPLDRQKWEVEVEVADRRDTTET